MSKATKGTSTLFPQVSRGESADAAKALLDDAGDSSGDEAHGRRRPAQCRVRSRVDGVWRTPQEAARVSVNSAKSLQSDESARSISAAPGAGQRS